MSVSTSAAGKSRAWRRLVFGGPCNSAAPLCVVALILLFAGVAKFASGCLPSRILTQAGACSVAALELAAAVACATRYWRFASYLAVAIGMSGVASALLLGGDCRCLGAFGVSPWQEGVLASVLALLAAHTLGRDSRIVDAGRSE
jgi:hypothetical protein